MQRRRMFETAALAARHERFITALDRVPAPFGCRRPPYD